LPYCRRCGTRLEENARFCHKCGTQVVIFSPAPPAKSAPKNSVSTPVIVLIAVAVALAVIVSVFIFLTFYPVNFNQTNPANQANQTNITKLSFKLQEDIAQANVLAQNLTDKTGFNAVSAAARIVNQPLIPLHLNGG